MAIGAVLVSVLAPVSAAAEPDPSGAKLRIYSSLPLQGDSRPQSEDIVRAIQLALEQAPDTLGQFEIDYVSLDDASEERGFWDPEKVESNARQAAADPRTIAYIGEFNSGASTISIPILNEAGILQVSPSNTYVGLTRSVGAEPGEPDVYYPTGKRHYGRVVPADHTQAAAQVALMQEEGCSNVFIANDGETYGAGIAAEVERLARGHGLPVLDNVVLDLEARNFQALARKVSSASPDCFFLGGLTWNRATEVANAVGSRVPRIKMFFPDGCAESAFTEYILPRLQPRVFITNPTLDEASYPPAGRDFFDTFRARYGRTPEPYAIYGFEAASVILDSIERAGETAGASAEGRQAVIDAFFRTEDRDSVLGTYDIDANGDTTLRDYGIYRVEDGLLVFGKVVEAVEAESGESGGAR